MMLAGTLFATTAEISHGTDLRVSQRAHLTDLIAAEERDVIRLRARVRRLRRHMDAVTRRAAQRDSRIEAARARQRRYDKAAGFESVTGPGLRVTLDDAPRPDPGEDLPGDPTPNDLVVHQQDVQAVVNALWAGGARAVQVMDQRLLATSAVRCVGNTLILHGVVYSPPYTIVAVGDPQRMRAALRKAEGVRIYRQYVRVYGLGYEVTTLSRVRIPAYSGLPEFDYAAVPSS